MNALTIVGPGRLPQWGKVLDLLMERKVLNSWQAISIWSRTEMQGVVGDLYKERLLFTEKKFFSDRYNANDYLFSLSPKYRYFDLGRIIADEKRPYRYFPGGIVDLANMIRGVEEIIADKAINILISDYPASALDLTAYQLVKSQGMFTIIINGFRTGDRLFFNYEPEKGRKEYITYHYQKFKEEGIPAAERQHAEEYLSFFRKTRYKAPVYQFTIPKKRNLKKVLTPQKLSSLARDFFLAPETFASRINQQTRALKLRKKWDKVFSPMDKRDRIIFFPIQYQPEASTYLKSPFYRNQYSVMENLCLCIPAGYTLYVKEHNLHIRSKDASLFDKYLKNFPNLKFVDLATDSHELINRADLVVVLSSTVGWEAYLYGVPVLQFGNAFYSEFKGVYQFGGYEHLSDQIDEIISNHKPDEEDILTAIAAVFRGTFPGYIDDALRNPSVLSEENIGKMADTILAGMNFYPEWSEFRKRFC